MTDQLITDDELATLNAARTVLARISRRATSAAWDAPQGGSPSPASLGRLAGAADVAGGAIFNTINTATSYGHQSIPYDVLHYDVLHNRQAETVA